METRPRMMCKFVGALAVVVALAGCTDEKNMAARILYSRPGLDIEVVSYVSETPPSKLVITNRADAPRSLELVIYSKRLDAKGEEIIGRQVLRENLKPNSDLELRIDGDKVVNLEMIELDGEKLTSNKP